MGDFVSYEIAKRLADLGFDEMCPGWWFRDGSSKEPHREWLQKLPFGRLPAPTWSQALPWVLKKMTEKHPMMRFTLFSDGTGHFTDSEDKLVNDIDFNDINDGIEQALNFIS